MNISGQTSVWQDILKQAKKIGGWALFALVAILVMYGLNLH